MRSHSRAVPISMSRVAAIQWAQVGEPSSAHSPESSSSTLSAMSCVIDDDHRRPYRVNSLRMLGRVVVGIVVAFVDACHVAHSISRAGAGALASGRREIHGAGRAPLD
jgi:hypothetical protein